ncbi:MAG TPA: zf-HC2 domain-containing protein [Methylophilaceae bacterium]|nr:zf-HC2 domain-containing protein [Methylophilaceae bacterium]
MLSCKQSSQLLSQALDRKLLRRELMALRLHLMLCSMCRRFGQQVSGIRSLVRRSRQLMEQDETLTLPPEAKQRIARALQSQRTQGT